MQAVPTDLLKSKYELLQPKSCNKIISTAAIIATNLTVYFHEIEKFWLYVIEQYISRMQRITWWHSNACCLSKKLNSTQFNLCHIVHSVSNQFCNQLIEVCFVAWFFVVVITAVVVMLASLIDQCSNGKSYITWLSFLTNHRTLFSIQAFIAHHCTKWCSIYD